MLIALILMRLKALAIHSISFIINKLCYQAKIKAQLWGCLRIVTIFDDTNALQCSFSYALFATERTITKIIRNRKE